MSKDSIRAKIEVVKKDANDLLKKGKVGKESIAVIKSLLLIIDIVVSVLLEKKNSKEFK